LKLRQDRGVIFDKLDVRRLYPDRAGHERPGLLEVSGTCLDKPQEMERMKIVRISVDQFAIELGRLPEITLLMK
jgi:hypothetical protein